MAYRILMGIDLVAALVVGAFFVAGVADGSVSSFNIVLWLAILGTLALVLLGGAKLHAAGRRSAALAVLAIVAVPAGAYLLFFGIVLVTQPRWN